MKKEGAYYSKEIDSVLKEFDTSKDGLPKSKVSKRISQYGYNELVKKEKNKLLKMILNQFSDLMIIILIIACIVSFGFGFQHLNQARNSDNPVLQKIFSYKEEGLRRMEIEELLEQQGFSQEEIEEAFDEATPGELIDGIVILVIVILNGIIGFMQEFKAEKALEALKKMVSPTAKVIRDGKEMQIKAKDIVPGDILVLEEGASIPADARLIEAVDFKTDESALTGESTPVVKIEDSIKKSKLAVSDQKNMVFMGTLVSHGRARALVVSTGMKTEFGKIAEITQEIKDDSSPLQKELFRVGKFIAKATLVIVAIVFGIGLLMGHELLKMFLFGVGLAIAAVPEGLPATVTIALALGVQRMAKKKAVMRRLSAVESLGSTTVICSDKTGTLTKNQMTVKEIHFNGQNIEVSGLGYQPKGGFIIKGKKISDSVLKEMQKLLHSAALCNDAELTKKNKSWHILGDPTEGSLVVLGRKAGIDKEKLEKQFSRIAEIPFDSKRKLMTTVNKYNSKKMAFVKGAPSELLPRCRFIELNGKVKKLDPTLRKKLLKENDAMASKALRVLGFAYRDVSKHRFEKHKKVHADVESNLIFLGLIGMLDPPREDVKESVALCKKAGIKIVVITGDHAITAKAIAQKLGIVDDHSAVVTGMQLNSLSDKQLKKVLKGEVIFARVSPEHKLRVVTALEDMGHVVAVTGDGVNDAPALKKADMGVAMGITGTDVSKEASDMVLMDDSFSTIVSAVKEGRTIYDDIKKFMRYIFSCNLGELFTVFFGLFLFPKHLIISATQILWVDLGTDVLPALALGVDPPEEDIMERKPRDPKERIITVKHFMNWLFTGLFLAAGVLYIFMVNTDNVRKASTMAFTLLVFFQMVNVFNCRSDRGSLFKVGILSNRLLLVAVSISLALQVLVVQTPFFELLFKTVPLALNEWLFLAAFAMSIFVFDEIRKLIMNLWDKSASNKS